MIWILPMAGKGKRTRRLGEFKPFVDVNKKKIIEWFFIGIKKKLKKSDSIIFITTKYFEKKFNFKKKIKKILKKNNINVKNIFFKLINETPNGPAYTVNSIYDNLKNIKQPCIVINSDQYIDFQLPKEIDGKKIYLPIHFNNHGYSSYVKINKNGDIEKIEEKKLISNYASSGVYIFGSAVLLKKILRLIKIIKIKKEINMSELINAFLIKFNRYGNAVPTLAKYDLGNSKNIKNFILKDVKVI